MGKKYDITTLSYYNRGYQFPTVIMANIDGAMNTVLFSALAQKQNDSEALLRLLRRSIKTSMYVCAPLMIGLATVAKPLVGFLLTDKWLPAVLYVQIICIECLFWPLSAKIQAVNAIGKSGVALTINIISKTTGLVLIFIALRFNSYVFAGTGILCSVIISAINVFVYRKVLNYKISHQIIDVLPPIILSGIMGGIVFCVSLFSLNYILTLLIQVVLGAGVYIVGSKLFHFESYVYILTMIKKRYKKEIS